MSKLLKIDLSKESIDIIDITELQKDYVGGIGINTKLACDLIPPGINPLSPENVLLFGVGALVGTLLPSASRTEATAKSPLSSRFGTANSGAYFGASLKSAGFDHIAILGRSRQPVCIIINDETIKIEDASLLWGKDTWQTVDEIRTSKGSEFQIASIGQAGENLVRYASIQNGYSCAWGRTGLGAVMGSKNLKAIAVNGTQDVKISEYSGFLKIMKEAFKKVKGDAFFDKTRMYGSMLASDSYNEVGYHGACNFKSGYVEKWEETKSRDAFTESFKAGDIACFSCPVACAHWSKVKEGKFKGYEARGVEVAWVLEFGSRLGLDTIPEILRCAELCHRYGMDIISAAGNIAYIIDVYERGQLTKNSVGVDLKWGDLEVLSWLLGKIAAREGIGNLLADGVKVASQRIKGTQDCAFLLKGVELPAQDPRGKWDTWTMGYLTNTRGGDHLRSRSSADIIPGAFKNYLEGPLGPPVEFITDLDMPQQLKERIFGNPPSKADIPLLTKYGEDLTTIFNSVGLCIRRPLLRSLGPDIIARALSVVTGIDYTAEGLLQIGENIWNLQHQFNLREGETKAEYVFPQRFYEEDLPAGSMTKSRLDRDQVEQAVKRYFSLRGWDFQ